MSVETYKSSFCNGGRTFTFYNVYLNDGGGSLSHAVDWVRDIQSSLDYYFNRRVSDESLYLSFHSERPRCIEYYEIKETPTVAWVLEKIIHFYQGD